jgi:hypothetical protein
MTKLFYSTVLEVTPETTNPAVLTHGLQDGNAAVVPDVVTLTPMDSTDLRFYVDGSGVDATQVTVGWGTLAAGSAKVKVDVWRWQSVFRDLSGDTPFTPAT